MAQERNPVNTTSETDEIKSEIERTRSEMSETLGEIQDRLRPDLEGAQVADVIAFTLPHLNDRLWPSTTIRLNGTVFLTTGHTLYSELSRPLLVKWPFTPTTALSFSNARVVAGSSRSTAPLRIAATTAGGRAAASTLSPAARAALGLNPPPTPPAFAP